jgi:hypothetical protein
MNELDNIKINESEYVLERGGKGKIVVLMYTGSADPKAVLDEAVRVYVGNKHYHEFIDVHLDNPWTRVIMSDVNGMSQRDFNKDTDRM